MKVIAEETVEQKGVTTYAERHGDQVTLRLISWGPVVVITMDAHEARDLASVLNKISEADDGAPKSRLDAPRGQK